MDISEKVKTEVFKLFSEWQNTKDKLKLIEARNILNKLRLQITDEHDTETKRLIYMHLFFSNYNLGDVDASKHWIKHCKEIINADKDYIYKNVEKYLSMQNNYFEVFSNEATIQEKIDMFEVSSEYYKHKKEQLGRYLTAKYKLHLLKGEEYLCIDVLEEIHNYIVSFEKSNDENIIEKLRFVESELLREVKETSLFEYNYIMETFYNTSANTLAI